MYTHDWPEGRRPTRKKVEVGERHLVNSPTRQRRATPWVRLPSYDVIGQSSKVILGAEIKLTVRNLRVVQR